MTTKLPTAPTSERMLLDFTTSLLNDHGLYHWRVQMKNVVSKFGDCNYRTRTIGLSKLLLHCTQDAIFDVISHEVAHAIVGRGHNHDYVWRAMHIKLGGSGERAGNNDHFINGNETANMIRKETAKYIAVCPNGHVHYYSRLPKSERSCGLCSRRFDRRFLLVPKLNV
jgi:hypothetical protein